MDKLPRQSGCDMPSTRLPRKECGETGLGWTIQDPDRLLMIYAFYIIFDDMAYAFLEQERSYIDNSY
jgi:hypothetical protein